MKKVKSTSQFSLPDIKDWHAILAIVVMVAAFFRDVLLQNAFFWEDFLYQFYPFRNFAAVSLAGGELPLWNPYTFSGTPFQADIQSALFYIPNLLLTLFVSGGRVHFFWLELFIILHIMVAGISMYFLAKEFGILKLFALMSGMTFALSGFMITHTIHQVIICQVAWLPLIVLLFRRSLLLRSPLHMILAGLVLGHAMLAGFPQLSLYIFFFLFLYFLFEFIVAIKEKGLKSSIPMVPLAAGVIILAVAFTAIQLLPTIELAPLSQRAEITFTKSLEGQLTWQQLITIIIPKFFGSSGAQGSTFWGASAAWVYWETCFYIGVPALILVVFSLSHIRQNRYVAFFAGMSVFAVLYAIGDNFIFHKFFFNAIPGFDKFRSIGRMTLLSTFSFSLLAGIGLQKFMQLIAGESAKIKKALLIIGGAGIVLWLIVQFGFLQPAGNIRLYDTVHQTTMNETTTAVVFIFLSVGVLYLIVRKTLSPFSGVNILLLLQLIDVNLFGFDQNNGATNPNEYYAQTAPMIKQIKEAGMNEYFRVNARRENAIIIDRNQGMVDRIFMMEGYTPLSLKRIYPPMKDFETACDLFNAKFRIAVDYEKQMMNLTVASTYLPRAFMVYRAEIIPEEENVKKHLSSSSFNPRTTVVLEEDPRFKPEETSDPVDWQASITSYHLNSIELSVSTARKGFLVLSEIYYPGWIAYIDGSPRTVYRANWSFRAIPIEEGKHRVEVRFEPKSFYRGAWITLASIGLSAIGVVYSFRRKKKSEPQPEQIK